jgi:hypothetical protein
MNIFKLWVENVKALVLVARFKPSILRLRAKCFLERKREGEKERERERERVRKKERG